MKDSLIIAMLKNLGVELFGGAVFVQQSIVAQNVTKPVQKAKTGTGHFIQLEDETGSKRTVFLHRSAAPNKASYDIALFKAERDASGKGDNGPWSIKAGTVRAYAV